MQMGGVPTYVLTAEVGHVFIPIVRRLARQDDICSVCDFGGGANPVLSLDDIAQLGVRYLVVDSSEQQLDKTPAGYNTRLADVANPTPDLQREEFDLVVSRFVAEHIADPVAFHSAVWAALRPGGFAAHFFPTLPSPPFVVNRFLMARGSRRIVDLLQPGSRAQDGQLPMFRAYYRWCEGPTERQYRRYASAGFTVEDYIVHVGHNYYRRFPPVQKISNFVSRQLVRRPRPALSTYAAVVLRRRSEDELTSRRRTAEYRPCAERARGPFDRA